MLKSDFTYAKVDQEKPWPMQQKKNRKKQKKRKEKVNCVLHRCFKEIRAEAK